MFDYDQVIITLWGQSGSSKSHFVRALVQGLAAQMFGEYAIGSVHPHSLALYERVYGGKITPTLSLGRTTTNTTFVSADGTAERNPERNTDDRRQGVVIRLKTTSEDGVQRELQLVIFDPAGEELDGRDDKAYYQATEFSIGANILVFFVPPPALGEKVDPSALRSGMMREGQTPVKTQNIVAKALSDVREAQMDKDPTVIFALAKADRLRGAKDFPNEVLEPRSLRRSTLSEYAIGIRDQDDQLNDYLVNIEAVGTTNAASVYSFPYHIVAIGGIGHDEDGVGAPASESRAMPSGRAAVGSESADHSGDPLLIGLLNLGYLTTVGQRSTSEIA
ncbi:hypothetical protein [Rathayibacter sp. AY1C6]|uniref:hypothetical protein n=1 Tax=Rathayibacter sp. AY1C6 TaxID=2080539 RepID=UPI0011B0A0CE|nr:hypothetical protein [Rathayibacter sp. AY1C6]